MTDNEMVGEVIALWGRKSLSLDAKGKNYQFEAREQAAWLAIQDVLAIPSIPDIGTVTGIEDAINHGRNLALTEVRQAITNRLGGMK